MVTHDAPPSARNDALRALCLTALGVVFGDIGTSPIYAIRESFHQSHGVTVSTANTLGILSLIFWSLVVVISLKYLTLVMRADNEGEGGIIALAALVMPGAGRSGGPRRILVLMGLFGAALLYGDSMITPAISVLSALEGLEVVTPVLRPYVLPLTTGILIALFSLQKRGTAGVGSLFGPVTLVWFLVLAALGVTQIVRHPGVLVALNPYHAASFFWRNGLGGVLVLGSVFLVVTGGEALYADMGHFGRRPIRLTWSAVVMPALVLNYFGQGALIIAEPATVEHPFFQMAPSWSLPFVVALATTATVIASQAVITGAFSLTRQAVQLGYLPRITIDHTSDKQIGQIYIPAVNWTLMLACIGLVLGFGNSGRLAAAYGVAVTTDMVFTTLLFAVVARLHFRWPTRVVVPLASALLIVDLAFWIANLPKVPHGGWFPLLVALIMFTLMTTWKLGRAHLKKSFRGRSISIADLVSSLKAHPPRRVPGTAIFLTSHPPEAPRALLHNMKHNKILHERVIFLTVQTLDVPYVGEGDRVTAEDLGMGFHRVTADFGFAESPSVPDVLRKVDIDGYRYSEMADSFFVGELTVVVPERPRMPKWRALLFERMHRNAQRATAYFDIPPNRVVGLGAQVEL
jgi:KUP system potassium uptake protein